MSRIVSPVPVVMTIAFNELTGQADFKITRELPFPLVVSIFCQLLVQFVNQGITAASPIPAEQPKPPTD